MPAPTDFPRNPDGSFVSPTWAEGGTAVEPSSGRKATGFVNGDVVTEGEINWVQQTPLRGMRATESYAVRTNRMIDSWLARYGFWEDGTNPLEAYLTDGSSNTQVADVYVNATVPVSDDGGGTLMQVSVPLGGPLLLTANRTHYIAVPDQSTSPPTVTLAELSVDVVALGNPPSGPPPPGYVNVWRIDSDGVGINSQDVLIPNFPAFQRVGFMDDVGIMGDLDVEGTSNLQGEVTLGNGLDANNQDIYNVNEISAVGPVSIGLGGISSTGLISCDTFSANSVTVSGVLTAENTIGTFTVDVPLTCNSDVDIDASGTLNANGVANFFANVNFDGGAVQVIAPGSFACGGTATFTGATVTTAVGTATTLNGTVTANGNFSSTSRTSITSLTSIAEGDLSKTAGGDLRWRDATSTQFVHYNSSGWVWGVGRADTLGAPALSLTLTTANSVAPKAVVDVIVEASVMVSRAVAGTVDVSLNEVGVGQLGAARTVLVPATGGSDFETIVISRTRSAMPTSPARQFSLTVNGGASNVTAVEGTIKVYPAT